jgi:sugar/nucleoside kinase (ribokinase family)
MSTPARPDLVCLGNFTIDDVVLPDGAERLNCTGGDALYATLAARLWNSRCELVAPVGNDLNPEIVSRIALAGLGLEGMPTRPLPTLHNRVTYQDTGEREWTLYASDSAFDILSPLPSDIPSAYRKAQAFLILAMTLPAQQRLVADLKASGAVVALDPQEDYIAGAEAEILRMISDVDIFMPSQVEVRRLTGSSDWTRAARYFAEAGPKIVAIKLGADGSLIHDARVGSIVHVPAYPMTSVVDTTGAGDSYCGAFMAAYLDAPHDLIGAARVGAVAASFTISGYGVDPLFEATSEQLKRRLENWS